MSDRVPVDAPAPITLRLRIETGDSGVDLATVTAATFDVQQPNQQTTTWTADITTQTVDLLILEHEFDGTEIYASGRFTLVPQLVTASGTIPCYPVAITGVSKFQI